MTPTRNQISWIAPVAAALILVATLPVAAAARTSTPTPQVGWAVAVCGSLSAWQHSLSHRADALGTLAPGGHAQAVKIISGALVDTALLEHSLGIAGIPSGPNGAAIANTLQVSAAAATKTLKVAKAAAVQRLTAGADPHASALAATVSVQLVAVGRTFIQLGTRFASPALDSAFEQAPACGLVHG